MSTQLSFKSRAAIEEVSFDFDFDDEPQFDIDIAEPPQAPEPLELAGVKAAIIRWLEQQA